MGHRQPGIVRASIKPPVKTQKKNQEGKKRRARSLFRASAYLQTAEGNPGVYHHCKTKNQFQVCTQLLCASAATLYTTHIEHQHQHQHQQRLPTFHTITKKKFCRQIVISHTGGSRPQTCCGLHRRLQTQSKTGRALARQSNDSFF